MAPNDIQIEESAASLRLSWNNRRQKKDTRLLWFLIPFWLVWAPLTLFATREALREGGFLYLWCFVGWAGTLIIPVSLLQSLGQESVELRDDGLEHEITGCVPTSRKHLPAAEISEVWLGMIDRGPKSRECVLTLNVFLKGRFEKRRLLGYWLSPESKVFVFERLRAFASARGRAFRFTDGRDGTQPERTTWGVSGK